MEKEYLSRKYQFLSSEDIDMLLLIAKLNLNYEEICLLKNKNDIDKFLKKYSILITILFIISLTINFI